MKYCSKCKLKKDQSDFSWEKLGIRRRAECRLCAGEREKRWRKNNPLKVKEKQLRNEKTKKLVRLKRRKRVLSYYGSVCSCCGESNMKFLCIDHVHGGGSKHRKSLGISAGEHFYRWLEKNDFPKGFQVLCHNCNFAKIYGECPHTLI